MNIALIDMGSNTVLLLIAEIDSKNQTFKTLLNKYESPRLGRGIKTKGNISEESINKLMLILKAYKELIELNKCSRVICTATNAMRIAKNAKDIIYKVKDEFGIEIEVISGDREAELTFLGASTALDNAFQKIVLDIGGGSTEVIFGSGSEIKFKKSFPVGVVSLTEQFIKNDIPSAQELADLKEFVNQTFKEITDIVPTNIPLIAVAGTPTSLSAINLGLDKYDDKLVEGSSLPLPKIDSFIEEFSKITSSEIMNRYGNILSGREDVILAGSIILKTVAELTKNTNLIVSGRGIRYGSIMNLINEL